MKASTINLINSLVLITFGTWGYFDFEITQSLTAFIPVGFGVILLICQKGVKTENKVIAHIAVVLTLIILIALASKIPGKLEGQKEIVEEVVPDSLDDKSVEGDSLGLAVNLNAIDSNIVVEEPTTVKPVEEKALADATETRGLGLFRICSMTFTCLLSMIAFVLSFIRARRRA